MCRVEGPRQVTLLLDSGANRACARRGFFIVEFRSFRAFIVRAALLGSACDGAAPVRHLPGLAPPVAPQGARPRRGHCRRAPTADKVRRLMHYGQVDTVLPCISSPLVPYLFFGFGSDAAAQHRRRRPAIPILPCNAAAQVWQEVIHSHGRQTRARHRLDPRGVNRHLTRRTR